MTSNDEQAHPYYRSPGSIRQKAFPRRMRGLDDEEVHEYLDLLADQVQAMDEERHELREENDRLQTELQGMQAKVAEFERVGDRVNEQVVDLFSQAQLVAEEMVEDVGREARQRLGQARAQERQIIEEAMQSAERTRKEAEAMITATVQGSAFSTPSVYSSSGDDAEQVRSYARAAQAQMQSIMNAFASQVERLGDQPRANGLDTWGSA